MVLLFQANADDTKTCRNTAGPLSSAGRCERPSSRNTPHGLPACTESAAHSAAAALQREGPFLRNQRRKQAKHARPLPFRPNGGLRSGLCRAATPFAPALPVRRSGRSTAQIRRTGNTPSAAGAPRNSRRSKGNFCRPVTFGPADYGASGEMTSPENLLLLPGGAQPRPPFPPSRGRSPGRIFFRFLHGCNGGMHVSL